MNMADESLEIVRRISVKLEDLRLPVLETVLYMYGYSEEALAEIRGLFKEHSNCPPVDALSIVLKKYKP
jgi:hypothetical protein